MALILHLFLSIPHIRQNVLWSYFFIILYIIISLLYWSKYVFCLQIIFMPFQLFCWKTNPCCSSFLLVGPSSYPLLQIPWFLSVAPGPDSFLLVAPHLSLFLMIAPTFFFVALCEKIIKPCILLSRFLSGFWVMLKSCWDQNTLSCNHGPTLVQVPVLHEWSL